ncbi:ParB/RepB/Spo0J family partition protein [Phascolarctobacterium sp.]|uniref:ParB/RepB/Spo0J family partition protein n=1 Tax=Phascolarctobacterium sp. TaxID=2049039 RepID=UPI00386AD2E9
MAGGFSVLNALNGSTKQQAEDRPGGRFRTKDINISDIYPNGRNFYAMQDIEALAEDIKAVGLLENLTVTYCPAAEGGENYKLLGGERRWRALTLLVQQGYKEFAVATCQIRNAENERAEMIEIIMCNRQRVKTVWEQIEEERQLKETLQAMKDNGEKLKGYDLQNGRLRDTVAAILNYSAAKVGQMETISKNLIPELQDALKAERINFSAAYTVAKMDAAGQQAALAAYEERGELSSRQAREAAEPAEAAETPDYGNDQQNVESICYRCTHWGDCYNKSATTVNCGTFEDKNTTKTVNTAEQEQVQTKQEQPETPQARVVDSTTGEVYESMQEAQKAAAGQQEPPQNKHKTHYIRLAATNYDDVASGKKAFELLKNDRDYKTGDLLEMSEFKDGRNTGRVITAEIVYMLEGYTGLTDGYCILGTKVIKEG